MHPIDGEEDDLENNVGLDVEYKDYGSLEFYDARPPDDGKIAKLNGSQFAGLLARQPQFADKCDWTKLGGGDWAILLEKQPQFRSRRAK